MDYINAHGMTYIDAYYDDPKIYRGQGTIGIEILKQNPDIDTMVVPIGGGALITRIAVAAKTIKPDIRIIGVQTDACPAMIKSYEDGVFYKDYPCESSVCDALIGGVGALSYQILKDYADDLICVSEESIGRAVSFMARKEKYIAEAGSCSTVAAVMEQRERIGGHGALPQNCVDPVVAACQIITAWQTIVSREVPPADTAVLSVGGINVERATYNIIPEKVSVVAGIRICSEDFAWYQIRIPGALMFLGVGNEAKGTNYAQHHAKFNTDDDAIALGVTGLVAITWDFLLNKK